MEYENVHVKKITDAAKEVSLSDSERDLMRARVRTYMVSHPRPKNMIVRVWYALSVRPSFSLPLHPVALGLVLALSLGAGSSYAAEGALPGDVLYVVKTQVNERVETLLATTPEKQAEVALTHTERRLSEAEQLAVQGRLSESASVEIGQSIAAHIDEYEQHVSSLEHEDTVAASAQSDLEATLTAHGDVLSRVASDSSEATSVVPLISQVEAYAKMAREKRTTAEERVARAGENARVAVHARKERVSAAVTKTERVVSAASTTVATEVGMKAEQDTESAAATLASGDTELQRGDIPAAFNSGAIFYQVGDSFLVCEVTPSVWTKKEAKLSDIFW